MKIEILTKTNAIILSHFPDGHEDNIGKAQFSSYMYKDLELLLVRIERHLNEVRRAMMPPISENQLPMFGKTQEGAA